METDLDMDPADAAAIEERLYSQFHHALKKSSNPESTFITIGNKVPSRMVSKTSVVNNAPNVSPFSNKKRYWASAEGYQRGRPPSVFQSNVFVSKEVPPKETSAKEGEVSSTPPPKKLVFTPYQSLLGNQNGHENNRTAVPSDVDNSVSKNDCTNSNKVGPMIIKPKPTKQHLQKKVPKRILPQSSQHPVKKKLSDLVNLIEKNPGQNQKSRLESKKAKACMVRKRNAERIVAKINLASSDEEPESSAKSRDHSSKSINRSYEHDDDDDDDEIEVVELPPAPKICIDCSDEEMTQDSFALPQTKTSVKKVAQTRVANSPRCLSPSNSSIMSDDFIGLHDRSRLNDSFAESIPNDDELECSLERHAGGYKAAVDKPSLTPREQRAPSISSEETFTSSDTTDQEKRLQESHNQNKPKALSLHGNPRSENVAGSKAEAKDDQQSKNSSSQGNCPKQNKTSAEEPTAVSSNASKSGEIVSRRKCKSPISMALELARKQFETGNRASSVRSAKKKLKNDQASDTSKIQPPETDQSPSAIGKDSVISTKNKAKKIAKIPKVPDPNIDSLYQSVSAKSKPNESTDHLRSSAESESSESDYDFEIAMPDDNSPPETNQSSENLDERKSSEESLVKDTPREELDQTSSSESDYDENVDQAAKSTPKAAKEGRKRAGRKRKQYNSETYSDEDFASMLTYIVQAMSDSDSEEEDPEEQEGKSEKKKQRKPEEQLQQDNLREPQKENQAEQEGMMEMERKKQRRQSQHDPEQQKQAEPETEAEKKKQRRQDNKPEQQEEHVKQQHKQEGVKMVEMRQEIRQTEVKEQEKHVKHVADDSVQSSTTVSTSLLKRNYGQKCDGPSAKKVKQSENVNSKEFLARHAAANDDIEIVEDITPSGYRTHMPSSSRHGVATAPQEIPDCAWNEEMKLFYNHVWMDEDFNLSSVLKKMPRDKSQWKICQKDLYPDRPKKEIICNNCGDRGHMRNSCRNRPKPRVCYMCGETGHQEPRCPNTICLNCGSRTRSFVRECRMCTRDINSICRLCNVRGHLARACPDNWRRYHSTKPIGGKACSPMCTSQMRVVDGEYGKYAYHLVANDSNAELRLNESGASKRHSEKECAILSTVYGSGVGTQTEDNVPLNRQYRVNRNARQCCICRKPGHPAHKCMAAYRIFGQAIPTVEIQSYQPTYPCFGHRRAPPEGRRLPRYNLFSDNASSCELNLHELAANTNGFYYRFSKSVGLLPKHKQLMAGTAEREVGAEYHEIAPSTSTFVYESSYARPEENETKEDSSPRMIGRKKECENRPLLAMENAKACVPLLLEIAEESNSAPIEDQQDCSHEKLTARDDGAPSVPNTAHEESAPLPDFIPLCSETNVALSCEPPLNEDDDDAVDVAALTPNTTPSEGRVYLSKPHAKKLLSAQGNEFLNAAAQNHSLKLSISFESFGNVLLLNGQSHAQDLFHEELKRFLDASDTAQTNERCALANNVPRTAKKALKFIKDNLQMLTEPLRSVQELFQSYQAALKRGLNKKTQEKLRRSLNIALFGHFGLRDGAKHLEALCVKMQQFLGMKSLDYLLLPNQRSEIQESSMYIFSSFDHRDYIQIVKEYDSLRRGSKKKLGPEMLTPGQVFLQQVNANHKRNELPDLMLNTSDQLLVDTDRLNTLDRATRDYQDNQTMERIMTFAGDKRFKGKREETYSYNESLLGQCYKLVKNVHHKEAQRLMRVLSTYGRKTSTEVLLNMLTMLQGMQPHTFRR